MDREKIKRNILLALLSITSAILGGLVLVFFLDYTYTGINLGPFVFNAPTSIPSTLQSESQGPTATAEASGPTLEFLGVIQVFGNLNQGVQIAIPETGTYRFAYREGTYSTYPIGGSPEGVKTWITAVYVFSGDHANWNGTVISFDDLILRVADRGYFSTSDEAEQAAQGQFLDRPLSQGDILTLIAVDHFDAYSDNPGEVLVELFLITYN